LVLTANYNKTVNALYFVLHYNTVRVKWISKLLQIYR